MRPALTLVGLLPALVVLSCLWEMPPAPAIQTKEIQDQIDEKLISLKEIPPVQETFEKLHLKTERLDVKINKLGYVSGTAAGAFVDKKTGARDLGFGLHIMDFLMAPGWADDDYSRDQKLHGNLPKHYIEGPQICTQAKELKPEVKRVKDLVVIKMKYQFTKPAKGLKAGSVWEQTLVFRSHWRYMLCCEKITSVNSLDNVFYRIDMPGHIKHKNGDSFSQIYLSYHDGMIPSSVFEKNFGPDDKYLYQRKEGKIPERFIRAYQVNLDGKPGPWLAGMTLDPTVVSEAWCHQRDYVCFIEELHGKAIKAGESLGAAYVVGWFDDIPAMHKVYDAYRGMTGIEIKDGELQLIGAKLKNLP